MEWKMFGRVWSICWNSFYPLWHMGEPIESDCDVDFEICLGCFHIYRWKEDKDK